MKFVLKIVIIFSIIFVFSFSVHAKSRKSKVIRYAKRLSKVTKKDNVNDFPNHRNSLTKNTSENTSDVSNNATVMKKCYCNGKVIFVNTLCNPCSFYLK